MKLIREKQGLVSFNGFTISPPQHLFQMKQNMENLFHMKQHIMENLFQILVTETRYTWKVPKHTA